MMKKDCSKTVNLIKEWNRMCSEIGTRCSRCPLSCNNNGTNLTCFDYIKQYPGKVAEIVQTWSDARRQKTYVEDFFEKFPNAPKSGGSAHQKRLGATYMVMAATIVLLVSIAIVLNAGIKLWKINQTKERRIYDEKRL